MTDVLTRREIAAWAGFVTTQGRVFRAIEDDLRERAGLTHPEYEILLRLDGAPGHRERIQTLITATDEAYFPAERIGRYYRVKSGEITMG